MISLREVGKENKKLAHTKSLSIIVNDFDFDYSEQSPSSCSLISFNHISVSPPFKECGGFFL
jgi:hypothetical protein